ncbi:peptidoglycan-binding protein [Arthrobacter sp. fls2-241-R2A-200]|uniref:peptidoglycan-binding protein n=1 Tax=unclassified Arthrobacter TaxID=235627 RepID=UPI00254D8D44|nr:peptidoglycan-binding protein [Arthrobacter sp. fls2-241-R2A-200]
MSVEREMPELSEEELMSQGATALPDKEVASVLDLNADLNLGISAAAPIDLGVAANANVAAPIDAGASANVLSFGSESQALAQQGALIDQGITGDATAHSVQDSGIDQGSGTAPTASPAPESPVPTSDGTAVPAATTGTEALPGAGVVPGAGAVPAGTVADAGTAAAGAAGALNGNLLNVDVNLDANAGIAAPINGAVAANANVAAPIDAAVGANIGSIDSQAVAVSHQDAIINQDIHGNATSSADQQSTMKQ